MTNKKFMLGLGYLLLMFLTLLIEMVIYFFVVYYIGKTIADSFFGYSLTLRIYTGIVLTGILIKIGLVYPNMIKLWWCRIVEEDKFEK